MYYTPPLPHFRLLHLLPPPPLPPLLPHPPHPLHLPLVHLHQPHLKVAPAVVDAFQLNSNPTLPHQNSDDPPAAPKTSYWAQLPLQHSNCDDSSAPSGAVYSYHLPLTRKMMLYYYDYDY